MVPVERPEDMLPADHLRELQREAARIDGLKRVVNLVAQWLGGAVVLVHRTRGRAAVSSLGETGDVLAELADDIRSVADGSLPMVSATVGSHVVCVVPVGGAVVEGALVVVRAQPFSPQARTLVTDAARLLWLCWLVAAADRRQREMTAAESHVREAVFHLLMVGDLAAARRAAAALRPSLSDQVRVYVVECPDGARAEAARRCDEACGGLAWIVRCPVKRRHLIVLAPVTGGPDANDGSASIDDALRRWLADAEGAFIGASRPVGLREVADGYEQSRHAMTLARGVPEHYARFRPRGALPAVLDPRAALWARRRLAPLLDYVPSRRQDPDAQELSATLMSWLTFYGGAAAQLKVHRNTLAARLRTIEQLLGCDLQEIDAQAELHLALHLLDRPRPAEPDDSDEISLDDLLLTDDVRRWAELQLAPLASYDTLVATVRTWLDHNARLDATATTLGLSIAGVRKRLLRAEEILERSLLEGPSARFELWVAVRAREVRSSRHAG